MSGLRTFSAYTVQIGLGSALPRPILLQRARASMKMDFSHADRAPADKLNVILWKDAMGNDPAPAMLKSRVKKRQGTTTISVRIGFHSAWVGAVRPANRSQDGINVAKSRRTG